jgi:hypothetical protein
VDKVSRVKFKRIDLEECGSAGRSSKPGEYLLLGLLEGILLLQQPLDASQEISGLDGFIDVVVRSYQALVLASELES